MAVYDFDDIICTKDLTHYVTGGNGLMSSVYNAFNQYVNTDYILFTMSANYPSALPISYNNGVITENYNSNNAYGYIFLPFQHLKNISKVEVDIKIDATGSTGSFAIGLARADMNATQNQILLYNENPPSQMSDFQHFEISTGEQQFDLAYGYLFFTFARTYKTTIKNIKIDGYRIEISPSGGAGSGYIGNSLVSNKKMVGYNVPTSDTTSAKTESVNVYSASATINTPKSGNGFAKITFMKPCWGGEEKDIMWAGNENKMTVQTYNNTLLFKLYLSNTVIYSFTAYAGIGVYDTENIYVGFLIDYDLQLAKPSMVYKNDTSYAYNQESPTDAEMGDIYTWLSAGTGPAPSP